MFTLLLAAAVACSQPVRVIDADTIEVCNEQGPERIRIAKLDAPETWRPDCQQELLRGAAASRKARQLLERPGAVIAVHPIERDRYGRTVASITVDGQDYATTMVQSGHGAWWTGKKRDWCK